MTLTLGGCYEVGTEQAVSSLLGYPPLTLEVFDLGPHSPPHEITPTDIGRLIVIEPLQQRVAIELLQMGMTTRSGPTALARSGPTRDVFTLAPDMARPSGHRVGVVPR